MNAIPRSAAARLAAGLLWLLAGAAGSATYTANVENLSTSVPKKNAAGTAWEGISSAQGDPNAGKAVQLLYLDLVGGDATGYPLSAPANAVQLRASTAGALLTCTLADPRPVLDASNAGTCTYRFVNTAGNNGDTLEISYLGLLDGQVRLNIGALNAAVGGHTVPAFDSDSVFPGTPPATDPALSRKPARLVVVFDKSGSMDWSYKLDGDASCGALYSPNANCRRWDALRRASEQMVSVAKAYSLTGDKLGVVFFNQDAENTAGLPPGSANAVTDMTTVTLDAIGTSISSRSPGGSTSIGDGIDNLLAVLNGGDNASFNNAMLVFTDGEQNNAKFIVDNGLQLLLNATNSPIGGSEVVPPGKQLKLCPFKLRTSNAADAANALLQTMADRSSCGPLNLPVTLDDPPVDAIQYFVQVLNGTLIGDKLEIVHLSQGTQPGTPGSVPPPLTMDFRTSQQDLAFTALLGWNPAFQVEGRPAMKLSKDGVDFVVGQDPNLRVDAGTRHMALTLRKPYCNAARQCVTPDGSWTLTVARTMARGEGRWSLVVVSDNATLASQFSAAQATPGVGNPLHLQARLTERGQPLAGLAAGSVRAFVSGPGQGLGNLLSASKTSPADLNAADPGIAANAKVQAMLANPAERAAVLAALQFGAEQGIALAETAPGVYSADFPATIAEGVYRVSFRVDATSAGNGAFMRVFGTDRYVPVQPDDAATAATMVVSVFKDCPAAFTGGCKAITFRPVDKAGNLVGPGKASSIVFAGNGSQVIGQVDDALDGSYSLVVGHTQADPTQVPPLSVNGLPLTLPPAAGPGDAGLWGQILQLLLQYWWWLLLLLLLILLALWKLRPKP